jgi:hypothetical protein
MYPILLDGQTVNVLPVNEFRTGDIVLYRDPMKRYLAHRILDVAGDYIVTAGDRNKIADAPITKEDVLGVLDLPSGRNEIPSGVGCFPNVYIHPNLASSDECQMWSNYLQTDIVSEPEPYAKVYALKRAGEMTILIHPGARQYIAELPLLRKNISIFIGYEAGEKTDSKMGTIGVEDVTFVARASASIWNERNITLELGVTIGFSLGRRTTCLG